jgi:hypothetical protein
MENLTTKQLQSILKTDYDYVLITDLNDLIFTNDHEAVEKYSLSGDLNIDYCIYTSDFENIFEVKDELKSRGENVYLM